LLIAEFSKPVLNDVNYALAPSRPDTFRHEHAFPIC
jgi:hypothetical protein